jgi:hypothetical protein
MGKGGDIPPTTKKVREKSCSWATWSFSTRGTIGVLRGSKAYSRGYAPYISRASFEGWLPHLGGMFSGSPHYTQGIFSGCSPYILGVSPIFSGHVFGGLPNTFRVYLQGVLPIFWGSPRYFGGLSNTFRVYLQGVPPIF